jgi:hypothetical protein
VAYIAGAHFMHQVFNRFGWGPERRATNKFLSVMHHEMRRPSTRLGRKVEVGVNNLA